eukprot:TRINITY_DN2517_c0_g1_i1.p1 TRINITY_DN2517_c0_g1~~TRINITY_DN2517_c0_g1_i1.p1  ORF type:complete len:934 (+),score=187.38 TRINITY_DN2517_c0_g1_i1:115-2916(+)
MGVQDIASLSNLDVLLGLSEQRFVLAEAAAAKHARAAKEARQALADRECEFEDELRKHLFHVKDLQDDRAVLAAEVRLLRQATAVIAEHKRAVIDTPVELERAAKALRGGDDVWRSLTWSEKHGVIAVVDKFRVQEEGLQRAKRDFERRFEEERTRGALANDELVVLKRKLVLVQELANSRMEQVGSGKSKVEEMISSIQRAEDRERELMEEVSTLKAAVANAESMLATSMTIGVPAPSAMPSGRLTGFPLLHALIRGAEEGSEGSTPASDQPESSPRHGDGADPLACPSGLSIPRRRSTGLIISPLDPFTLEAQHSPMSGTHTDDGRYSSPAGVPSDYAKKMMEVVQQMKREKDDLQAEIADEREALDKDREEVRATRAFYTAQLADLQKAEDKDVALSATSDALERSEARIKTVEKERVAVEDTLADVRAKVEAFYKRQVAKREDLQQQLDTAGAERRAAHARADSAEQALAMEKDSVALLEKEVHILRSGAMNDPEATTDFATQYEVEPDLQAELVEFLVAEAKARADIVLQWYTEDKLVYSEDLEVQTDDVAIGTPGMLSSPSPTPLRTPPQPDLPRGKWERGSPGATELPTEAVQCLAQLSLTTSVAGFTRCTTVVKIMDDETVGDLLVKGMKQLNGKLFLDPPLRPEHYALKISEDDDKAMREYCNDEKGYYWDAEEAPPFSTLFCPRDRPTDEPPLRDPRLEYCYSSRPLRTIAALHRGYENLDFVHIKRLWFTLEPARNPLPIPEPVPTKPAPPVRRVEFVDERPKRAPARGEPVAPPLDLDVPSDPPPPLAVPAQRGATTPPLDQVAATDAGPEHSPPRGKRPPRDMSASESSDDGVPPANPPVRHPKTPIPKRGDGRDGPRTPRGVRSPSTGRPGPSSLLEAPGSPRGPRRAIASRRPSQRPGAAASPTVSAHLRERRRTAVM